MGAATIAAGCKHHDEIATLASADGPVDGQHGSVWAGVAVGAKFFLGDAVRTADTGAGLELTGGAQIKMSPHTVLRFGADSGGTGAQQIRVELGAIDLSGEGAYSLGIGDVQLHSASLHITANGSNDDIVVLTLGHATITRAGGAAVELQPGASFELGLGSATITAVPTVQAAAAPAGSGDAAPAISDAGSDASAGSDAGTGSDAVPDGGARVEVTGGKAEVQAPDAKTWTPLAAGGTALAKGTKIRVGAGTTATLTQDGATLELLGGARAEIADHILLAAGSAKATVAAAGHGAIAVPAGVVELVGDPDHGAEARLDIGGRETRVAVIRGQLKLIGGHDAALTMNRGEIASVGKVDGALHPIEAIPTTFDFRINVGESFTVHDPRPPTAIQFQFLGKCTDGGVIELDHDGSFRTAKLSAGKENANLLVQPGGWAYRLRCSEGDVEGKQVASGRIVVGQDDGHRPLPKAPNENPIDADGHTYRISYQSLVPNILVHYKGPAGAQSLRLHVAQAGKDHTYDAKNGVAAVPGASLGEGTYLYWYERDGVKQDPVSTLRLDFEQTAPKVYIEAPPNATPFPASIDVRGAVLSGWSAAIDDLDVPLDHQGRFSFSVQRPPGEALAIRLSHPSRGVHYYLRRQK